MNSVVLAGSISRRNRPIVRRWILARIRRSHHSLSGPGWSAEWRPFSLATPEVEVTTEAGDPAGAGRPGLARKRPRRMEPPASRVTRASWTVERGRPSRSANSAAVAGPRHSSHSRTRKAAISSEVPGSLLVVEDADGRKREPVSQSRARRSKEGSAWVSGTRRFNQDSRSAAT